MRRSLLILTLLICGFLGSAVITSFTDVNTDTSSFGSSKKKKKKKKKKKDKPPKSDCNPNSLTRTSADSVILKKYVELYKSLGGVCYIKTLQKMGELEKTGEAQYTVYLGKSKNPEDRMAWTTYMYCPIGKPDGCVALVQESGDTVQYCTYKNEMKHGMMIWLKPRYGIVAAFEFINDEKPVAETQEYDPNGTPPPVDDGGTHNRTEDE